MFQRAHHQRINAVLLALDADLLRAHGAYFGGGTAIALLEGEWRESVDIDFLVSDLEGYRGLRRVLSERASLARFLGIGNGPIVHLPEVRADQYGIRARLPVEPSPIKFEIVFEARISFDAPGEHDRISGITTLSQVDLVASKLLANVDRWADAGVMSRDILDLAMLEPSRDIWRAALRKAEGAYGETVLRALKAARMQLLEDRRRLARCMEALQIRVPQALLHQRLQRLGPKV